MKVTAILPDKIISDVRRETKGKNITQALSIALSDWLNIQKTNKLILEVEKNPLTFAKGFSATIARQHTR